MQVITAQSDTLWEHFYTGEILSQNHLVGLS